MIIVTILIPLADNAAQVFSPEHHRAFETSLAETFNEFTRLPGTHHGAWIDGGTLYRVAHHCWPSWRFYTDATRAYQVAVAGLLERAEDIRRAVERARVHYRQEAIYVSYLGTAEILGFSA